MKRLSVLLAIGCILGLGTVGVAAPPDVIEWISPVGSWTPHETQSMSITIANPSDRSAEVLVKVYEYDRDLGTLATSIRGRETTQIVPSVEKFTADPKNEGNLGDTNFMLVVTSTLLDLSVSVHIATTNQETYTRQVLDLRRRHTSAAQPGPTGYTRLTAPRLPAMNDETRNGVYSLSNPTPDQQDFTLVLIEEDGDRATYESSLGPYGTFQSSSIQVDDFAAWKDNTGEVGDDPWMLAVYSPCQELVGMYQTGDSQGGAAAFMDRTHLLSLPEIP